MESMSKLLILCLSCLGVWGDFSSLCPPTIKSEQKYLRVFNDRCYEFAVYRETYWDSAKSECERSHGHLVTVTDKATQQFLMETLTSLNFNHNGIWIGLNDIQQENKYVWDSGAITHFAYWAPGEPSTFHFVEDCVIMKSTKAYHWEDHPCHLWPQHYSYICEYAAWGDDFNRCPSHLPRNMYLRTFRDRCYEFITFRETYWDQAGLECSHTGGRLVTVSDMGTQQFLVDTLTDLKFAHNGIWIGLNDVVAEAYFMWTTGQKANFTYWAAGEPSNFHEMEDCVLMKSTKNYHWEDHPCHLWPQYYSYICEYEMLASPNSTASTLQPPGHAETGVLSGPGTR